MPCITAEEFKALGTQTFLVPPEAVRMYHARALCSAVDVRQDCGKITDDVLARIVACKLAVDRGDPVLPQCMNQTHPMIINAVRNSCPEVAAKLDALLGGASPGPSPGPVPAPEPAPQPPPAPPMQAAGMSRGVLVGIVGASILAALAVAYAASARK